MARSNKKKLVNSVLGVVVGLVGLTLSFSLNGEPMNTFKEKCGRRLDGDDDELAPYDPWLGGGDPFACIVNQFFHTLINDEAWFFSTLNLVGLVMIVCLVLAIETVRTTSFWVKIPFLTIALGQYLGCGLMLPLLWIPFYVHGRQKVATTPEVHPGRIAVGCIGGCFHLVLIGFMLYFDQTSYAWGATTSVLSGPFVGLPMLLTHVIPKKTSDPSKAPTLSIVFLFASVVPLVLWVATMSRLFMTIPSYLDPLIAIIDFLYTEATFASQMLLLDLICMFLAMLLYVFNEGNKRHVRQTLLLSIVVGPGSAVAITLSDIFRQREERQPKHNKTSKST